ncbi:GDSL-type esterase/lipase family protein [Streptomyces spororaveus]|uniref:GDSL-type esterase/lipase family protein n=1 Tax=Streptomyces spororaveus TaxID=284039 RepID=UPI0037B47C23
MTIVLRPGTTVVFAGDSITGCRLRIAGEWGLRHPDRPVTWLNTGIGGHKVRDLEARWQTDVLDARPDVVSIPAGVNDTGWHTGRSTGPRTASVRRRRVTPRSRRPGCAWSSKRAPRTPVAPAGGGAGLSRGWPRTWSGHGTSMWAPRSRGWA